MILVKKIIGITIKGKTSDFGEDKMNEMDKQDLDDWWEERPISIKKEIYEEWLKRNS